MPEEPFDEDPLGDYDVGVIFLSEGEDHVQMTTFRWPLLRVRLEGGRYLSDIVQWLSDNAISDAEDGGLEGLPKNPYRHMKKKTVQRQSVSKLNKKTSTCDVQWSAPRGAVSIDAARRSGGRTQSCSIAGSIRPHLKADGRLHTQCRGRYTPCLGGRRNI
jgi:hypothetical protein